MLIGFHTDGTSAKTLMQEAKLEPFGDQHQTLLLVPEGDHIAPWRGPEVLPLTEVMLKDVRANWCIDEDRIFLLGNGSGGQAVDKLSCEPWIAGMATMGHRARTREFPCDSTNPVPYLNLAPLKTGHLPVDGGPGCFMEEVISLAAHDERWAERNRCVGEPAVEKVRSSTCAAYDCAAEYTTCHLDGGMPWPGQGRRRVDVFSCDGNAADFPFFVRIWNFFDRAGAWRRANAPSVR